MPRTSKRIAELKKPTESDVQLFWDFVKTVNGLEKKEKKKTLKLNSFSKTYTLRSRRVRAIVEN